MSAPQGSPGHSENVGWADREDHAGLRPVPVRAADMSYHCGLEGAPAEPKLGVECYLEEEVLRGCARVQKATNLEAPEARMCLLP